LRPITPAARSAIRTAVLVALAAAVFWAGAKARRMLNAGAGFVAKVSCSSVFVSGRTLASVEGAELALDNPLVGLHRAVVDEPARRVTVTLTPLVSRTAYFRPGLGCTLDSVQASPPPPGPAAPRAQGPWPIGDGEPATTRPELEPVLDWAFADPDPARHRRGTRAVVIVRDGRLVAERYGFGASAAMPLQGWSMGKSVEAALVGILVGEGKLDLKQPAPVPEWSAPGDPRHAITLEQLLHMTSGLRFGEDYADLTADAPQMLFARPDAAAYAAAQPLAHPPGTHWQYSSGTSNVLARIVRQAVGGTLADYWAFPREALFEPIGATSFVLEPDASGTFVGSSFDYATARDWARLGLLFLTDGVWDGRRILPEGWVRFLTTEEPLSDGRFGAHVWLGPGGYSFEGYEGQSVTMIPSLRAVVVRLGVNEADDPHPWDQHAFLRRVHEALSRVRVDARRAAP
jgi:CubicO group peptidase (beta-lactamase class C family)